MARTWKAVLAVSLALAISSGAMAQEVKLQLEGSTTVGPIADAFKEYFEKAEGWKIEVNKTGSGDGAAALVDSRCDIANMSRFMKEKEFKAAAEKGVMPVAHVVAMDGVCVVVNPKNSVSALTTAQVRDIYAGKITNWKELGGPDQKIVVISRDTSSGTYETFHKLVMGKGTKMVGQVEYVNSNPQAQARVQTTAGAIGYVGLAFQKGVKTLKVDGVLPSARTVVSGKYPVSRPLFMFTNGYPKLGSPVYLFVTFHLTEKGQDIVSSKGYVPVTDY